MGRLIARRHRRPVPPIADYGFLSFQSCRGYGTPPDGAESAHLPRAGGTSHLRGIDVNSHVAVPGYGADERRVLDGAEGYRGGQNLSGEERPVGAHKQSGIGRELGREGPEAFQETKHVHIETKIERKSWWYPYGQSGA